MNKCYGSIYNIQCVTYTYSSIEINNNKMKLSSFQTYSFGFIRANFETNAKISLENNG